MKSLERLTNSKTKQECQLLMQLKKGIHSKQIRIEVLTENIQDFCALSGRLNNLQREKPVKGEYSQLSMLLFRVLDFRSHLGQILASTYLRTHYLMSSSNM